MAGCTTIWHQYSFHWAVGWVYVFFEPELTLWLPWPLVGSDSTMWLLKLSHENAMYFHLIVWGCLLLESGRHAVRRCAGMRADHASWGPTWQSAVNYMSECDQLYEWIFRWFQPASIESLSAPTSLSATLVDSDGAKMYLAQIADSWWKKKIDCCSFKPLSLG